MATVPLGLARAALDDVVELATDKVPLLSPSPLATNPLFQYQLADAEVTLRVSRALLMKQRAKHGQPPSPATSSRPRCGHTFAQPRCWRPPPPRRSSTPRIAWEAELALPREPASASVARCPRCEPALLAQTRHLDHLRCRARRANPGPHHLLNRTHTSPRRATAWGEVMLGRHRIGRCEQTPVRDAAATPAERVANPRTSRPV